MAVEGDSDASDYGLEIDEELERDVESLREVLKAANTEDESGTNEDISLHLQLCIQKNQELQRTLSGTLASITRALEENRLKREKLRQYGRDCFKQACTLFKFKSIKSYFRDYLGKTPNLPSHLRIPTARNYYFEQNTWDEQKDEALRKHVLIEGIDRACRPLQSSLSEVTNQEEIKKIRAKIRRTMSNSEDSNTEQLLLRELPVDGINWSDIAMETFKCRKTAADCQQRWVSTVSPSVNSSDWSKEEAKNLMKLGKEFGGRNWKEIAERMETARFEFSYFKKYQTTFTAQPRSSVSIRWSKDLDLKLKAAVERYGAQNNWYAVAKHVGVPSWKCRERWKLQVNPSIKRGRWSTEEDKHLQEAFAKIGSNNWCQISAMVPNRTAVQCRERWVHVLDPNLEKGSWSPAEDAKLMEVCKQYEGNVIPWAKVAQCFRNRTDTKCKIRWRIITPKDEVAKYKKAVKIKKKIRVSSVKNTDVLQLPDFVNDDMVPDEDLKATDSTSQILTNSGTIATSRSIPLATNSLLPTFPETPSVASAPPPQSTNTTSAGHRPTPSTHLDHSFQSSQAANSTPPTTNSSHSPSLHGLSKSSSAVLPLHNTHDLRKFSVRTLSASEAQLLVQRGVPLIRRSGSGFPQRDDNRSPFPISCRTLSILVTSPVPRILTHSATPSGEPATLGPTPSGGPGSAATLGPTPSGGPGSAATLGPTPSGGPGSAATLGPTPSGGPGSAATLGPTPSGGPGSAATLGPTPSGGPGSAATLGPTPSGGPGSAATLGPTSASSVAPSSMHMSELVNVPTSTPYRRRTRGSVPADAARVSAAAVVVSTSMLVGGIPASAGPTPMSAGETSASAGLMPISAGEPSTSAGETSASAGQMPGETSTSAGPTTMSAGASMIPTPMSAGPVSVSAGVTLVGTGGTRARRKHSLSEEQCLVADEPLIFIESFLEDIVREDNPFTAKTTSKRKCARTRSSTGPRRSSRRKASITTLTELVTSSSSSP